MSQIAEFDVNVVAQRSKQGNLDGLAALVALNENASIEKLASLAKLDIGVMHRLMTTREFRERVTELMTYRELGVEKERAILRRMIGEATNEESEFKNFERAATWVYRQGGMLRGDRQEVDVKNHIKITFARDVPEESNFDAPDPMAGVVGLEDGRTVTVAPSEKPPESVDAEAEDDDE